MAEKHKISFPVLNDRGNRVAREYRLVYALPDYLCELYRQFGADLSQFNGDDSWTLPLPARYIIGRDGIIAHAEINADYTVRPDPAKTLARLKDLPGQPGSR